MRNRAHPEGSIAKGYLMEECMNFCSRYLIDVETKSNRPNRNDDCSNDLGRGLGCGQQFELDDVTFAQAHQYVLVNTDSIASFQK